MYNQIMTSSRTQEGGLLYWILSLWSLSLWWSDNTPSHVMLLLYSSSTNPTEASLTLLRKTDVMICLFIQSLTCLRTGLLGSDQIQRYRWSLVWSSCSSWSLDRFNFSPVSLCSSQFCLPVIRHQREYSQLHRSMSHNGFWYVTHETHNPVGFWGHIK